VHELCDAAGSISYEEEYLRSCDVFVKSMIVLGLETGTDGPRSASTLWSPISMQWNCGGVSGVARSAAWSESPLSPPVQAAVEDYVQDIDSVTSWTANKSRPKKQRFAF
jgi:hypothetical protein